MKPGIDRNPPQSPEVRALIERLHPPLLRGLTVDGYAEVLAQARLKHYKPMKVLVEQGHAAANAYLLLEGMARFYTFAPNCQKYLVKTLFPCDVIGGMALIGPDAHYLARCVTLTNAT